MPEKDSPISLVDYDARWPRLFVEERALLYPVLVPWLVGPIEHIGSTAVPGMAAKPVIDIMAAVESLEESRDAIAAVRSLDYLYAPYHPEEEHWFCKPDPAFRTHHLHLVPFRSAAWTARIAFRDRLREDGSIAAKYLQLKRNLAASFEHDREAYTSGKTEFVNRVLGEAARTKRGSQPDNP